MRGESKPFRQKRKEGLDCFHSTKARKVRAAAFKARAT